MSKIFYSGLFLPLKEILRDDLPLQRMNLYHLTGTSFPEDIEKKEKKKGYSVMPFGNFSCH